MTEAGGNLLIPSATLPASSTVLTPITVTGFNQDTIWGANEASPAIGIGTTASFDLATYELYASNVTGSPGGGLPSSGTISSHYTTTNGASGAIFSTVTFQLASYSAANTLQLTGSTPATLALAAPSTYENISILAATGNGPSYMDYTLNYADGSSTTVGGTAGVTVSDWYAGANYAIESLYRVTQAGAFDNTQQPNPRLYEYDYQLSAADQTKQLTSITFSRLSTSGGNLNIFAISGTPPTAASFTNNVVTTAGTNSTTSVTAYASAPTATLGTLSMGPGSSLNVNPTGIVANLPYGLTFGATKLSGNDTLGITNNGTATATLTLGALNDSGTSATLNLSGGTVDLTTAATSLVAGSAVNLTSGTLISGNGTSLGSAAVAVSAGATLTGSGSTGVLNDSGNLVPGTSGGPGEFTTTGLTLASTSTYTVVLNSNTVDTGYTQVISSGAINLNNAFLNLTAAATGLTPGNSYTIIQNNSGSSINGTFLNLLQGQTVSSNNQAFEINYHGGANGNSVVLTNVQPLYVDPDWAGYTQGESIADADPVAAGNQAGTFGTNAFATVDSALAAALPGQKIIISAGSTGTYPENVLINIPVVMVIQQSPISFGSLADAVSNALITLNTNLTVGADGASTTLNSPITGSGSFTKLGTGSMTLGGAESYTGGTIVSGGVLLLGSGAVLSPSGSVTIGSTGDLRLNGNSETIVSLTGSGIVENANSTPAILTVTGSGNTTFSGVLQNGTGGGSLGLILSGTGIWTLGGPIPSTYSGGTKLTAGGLILIAIGAVCANGSSDGAIAASSGTSITFATSGNISFDGSVTGAATLAVQGGGSLTLGSGAVISASSVTIGNSAGRAQLLVVQTAPP